MPVVYYPDYFANFSISPRNSAVIDATTLDNFDIRSWIKIDILISLAFWDWNTNRGYIDILTICFINCVWLHKL